MLAAFELRSGLAYPSAVEPPLLHESPRSKGVEMEMRVRISRLACAASLAVVIASCGSPDKQIDAAEAGSSGASTSSPSGTAVTESSVPPPQPQESTPQPHPSPTHAPGPAPPKPQPQPPAPQPQPPAPQPQPPAPPAPNPNPPPGTVSYDLPNVDGSDLADEDNWRSGYEDNCTRAGHPSDCLHMSVEVYAPDANGDPVRIRPDPGPNYADAGVYATCPVTAITPEPPAEVPVGTTVIIKVLCQPVDAEPA
jgi:hypothetical protein